MRLREALRDVQIQPEAAVGARRHGSPEPAEDGLLPVDGDADALVADRDQPVLSVGAHHHAHRLALAILAGIAQERGDDSFQTRAIPDTGRALAVDDQLTGTAQPPEFVY